MQHLGGFKYYQKKYRFMINSNTENFFKSGVINPFSSVILYNYNNNIQTQFFQKVNLLGIPLEISGAIRIHFHFFSVINFLNNFTYVPIYTSMMEI